MRLLTALFAINACTPAVRCLQRPRGAGNGAAKDAFIDDLVSQMTVQELVLQLHLMFGDNIVGPQSQNELYDSAMQSAPDAAVGNIHDWYPLNTSYYNGMQKLIAEKARLQIPFMHFGECLHGVGSYKQSMFPQSIGLSASFDSDLVYRVGRAIGTEARSIGVHACLSPVLDLSGKEPRFGRLQEAWGEDKVLTSIMGVAYASGLSKNASWSEPDAVVPVMKHFAAYGAPQSGLNAAPWMGHGNREILAELLMPFKAVVDLGGVRGVMMAYNELDDVPAHVSPMLYQALADWGYDGFVMGDDLGVSMLEGRHQVSTGPAETLTQWFNVGGMIQFYDYSLEDFVKTTAGIVGNDSVSLSTLQSHVKKILGVKYDLGLFSDSLIPGSIDPQAITNSNVPLTLEAAQRSIVLLENRKYTLPLEPTTQSINKLALIGPFIDTLNYGDYSGTFGASPVTNSSTLQQAILSHLGLLEAPVELVTAWGANQWLYNQQVPIPGHHLSPRNGSATNSSAKVDGLLATYFGDTNFTKPLVQTVETPFLDWGLYPPPGLPSNNFSATWEGIVTVPSTLTEIVEGYLGVAVYANTTATLYIDGQLLVTAPLTTSGNILSNIEPRTWTTVNSTAAPPGSSPFTFNPGARHRIRIEYQAYNLYQKIENQNSLNAQILLFWNLVDRRVTTPSEPPPALSQAIAAAHSANAIILHVGSSWSSDGEGGDRSALSLSVNQTELADAVFAAAEASNPPKPVILVLTGGRPLAIPQYYSRASAVLNTFFPGQQGGQAISDVLFGVVNPGGRLPVSVPRSEGQLPAFYNYKYTAHAVTWLDEDPTPAYPFGHGLSYSNFSTGDLSVSVRGAANSPVTTFSTNDTLTFSVNVRNEGPRPGSHVIQVYLLQRISQITQPVKQLVAFARVDLELGEERAVVLEVEVDRYLRILDRAYEWTVERGEYTFAVLEDGGVGADTGLNVTVRCV